MKRQHSSIGTSTPEDTSISPEFIQQNLYKRFKVLCATLICIQLSIALAVSIAFGVFVSNSHAPYVPADLQTDLKSLIDTHYMTLVGYIVTTVNCIIGLLGIHKDSRKLLNIYLVFTIITMLFKIASGCLYLVWLSKYHAIITLIPSVIDFLSIVSVYILRKRIKMASHSLNDSVMK